MLLREDLERREYEYLSEYATKAGSSKGRVYPEEEDSLRTCFQRDRDRIIHSKALRRLMHKTQVFLAPEGDHYRTRLTHTLEVSQIARTIARSLDLNEDLTEAIAMGHDLGHTPFGHNGEEFLNEIHPVGFKHAKQSLRVVDVIEKTSSGKPLNLSWEVRDGILNHGSKDHPGTPEGKIVSLSDRIAYINHDIDDALRAKVITLDEIPKECLDLFGYTHGERINSLVVDIIKNSWGKSEIVQSEEYAKEMNILRNWMFDNVYKNPEVKKNAELEKVKTLIFSLYEYYVKNPDKLPPEYQALLDEWGTNEAAKDYIAGMTDRYALFMYDELFVPAGWNLRN
jgi:dGTPase